jgi:hypothetical protein
MAGRRLLVLRGEFWRMSQNSLRCQIMKVKEKSSGRQSRRERRLKADLAGTATRNIIVLGVALRRLPDIIRRAGCARY